MAEPLLLSATGITKTFVTSRNFVGRATQNHRAVDGVDLVVRRGETVAVVGESGAGKSTLGRLVLRLIEPDDGSISLDGIDVRALDKKDLRALRKRMQMIFQDPHSSLDPRMVIEDAVGEPITVHFGTKGDDCRRRVLALLDRVGVAEHQADRYPHEFSGGQLQRIAIARALAVEPDLIVCDEPVAALDVSIRAQVTNLLADLQRERGVAYIFISHDLSLVRAIADRVAVMFQGRVVEEGVTRAIFERPRHPYTRSLLDAVPIADPRRRGEARQAATAAAEFSAGAAAGGCAYASRCSSVHDRCLTDAPDLIAANGQVNVRCHLVDPSSRLTPPATVTAR